MTSRLPRCAGAEDASDAAEGAGEGAEEAGGATSAGPAQPTSFTRVVHEEDPLGAGGDSTAHVREVRFDAPAAEEMFRPPTR